MVKYTKIYSGGMPEFKEDDIFRTMILLSKSKEKKYRRADKVPINILYSFIMKRK